MYVMSDDFYEELSEQLKEIPELLKKLRERTGNRDHYTDDEREAVNIAFNTLNYTNLWLRREVTPLHNKDIISVKRDRYVKLCNELASIKKQISALSLYL